MESGRGERNGRWRGGREEKAMRENISLTERLIARKALPSLLQNLRLEEFKNKNWKPNKKMHLKCFLFLTFLNFNVKDLNSFSGDLFTVTCGDLSFYHQSNHYLED